MEFTPKQYEAFEKLLSNNYNLILYGGAIRGGKSVWGLVSLLFLCEIYPKSRWCVIRENIERIRITTIPSFIKLNPRGNLKSNPYEYKHPNGSVILFKGENFAIDKELDWMKGLEVNGFLFEEINECQEQTLNKAFERAGAWIIPNNGKMPKPIILATCNPAFNWVKEKIYLPWKNGNLNKNWCYIPAKITDNPHLPVEYIQSLKNLPRYEYEVFVEGNWDIQLKTGGEFFKQFELDKHVKHIEPDLNNLIHISIDSNVEPYIAVQFWQFIKQNNGKWIIKQIHEIPNKDPYNTARRAAENAAKYLKSIGYDLKVNLYGDRSTKARNNIDDNKLSFAEIFQNTLQKEGFRVENKMLSGAPPVSAIADFVNAIFDQTLSFAEIHISDKCTYSINDYIETKQDRDGSMLKKREINPKTGVSYEPHGHFCDNLKDIIVAAFHDEFKRFQNRFIAPDLGGISKVKRVDKFTF